ncbi:hypothetical protein VP01_1436g2 [Puccinia sorghi]|uniref:Uncharacterized protein n=1 Tax=Puccinia sorghi TaxID=27349 RepID=A0A0L6VKB2_9BASI|nr:hypothetical protein VP01_1436g2 [Puccinia sorghi]
MNPVPVIKEAGGKGYLVILGSWILSSEADVGVANAQVLIDKVPRGLGFVPRGLDQATWPDRASWHPAKFCLAQPKL